MACIQSLRDRIPARYVLCLMLFLGFMVTFLLRVNLNMSVVAMVRRPPAPTPPATAAARAAAAASAPNCLGRSPAAPLAGPPQPPAPPLVHFVNESTEDVAFKVSKPPAVVVDDAAQFEWDEFQQGIVLGSFFWGYLIFQVPGGRVAEVFGVKKVFGGAVALNGLLALLLPIAARAHWGLLLVVRATQGLAQGVQFPTLSAAVAQWVPIGERAKFMSFTVCGASLGTVVAMPLCGAILSAWGWEAVFYTSGALALLWTAAWWVLVYESPDTHPRISEEERRFLASCLQVRADHRKAKVQPVPWKAVLSSWQFWLGCIAAWGNDWGFHTFLTLGPKYIKEALGFDLEASSWLASLPFMCQYLFATSYGVLADEILHKGASLLLVRRVSTAISHVCPAVLLVVLAFVGCNATAAVAILTTAVALIGAFSAGFFQNPLDVAPNFAGSLTGIMNGIGSLTGVISPPVAGAILRDLGLVTGWPVIFCIAAVMYLVSCLPYVLFATARVQPWNEPEWSQGDKAIAMLPCEPKAPLAEPETPEADAPEGNGEVTGEADKLRPAEV